MMSMDNSYDIKKDIYSKELLEKIPKADIMNILIDCMSGNIDLLKFVSMVKSYNKVQKNDSDNNKTNITVVSNKIDDNNSVEKNKVAKDYKLSELQKLCKDANLLSSGKKDILFQRLCDNNILCG